MKFVLPVTKREINVPDDYTPTRADVEEVINEIQAAHDELWANRNALVSSWATRYEELKRQSDERIAILDKTLRYAKSEKDEGPTESTITWSQHQDVIARLGLRREALAHAVTSQHPSSDITIGVAEKYLSFLLGEKNDQG